MPTSSGMLAFISQQVNRWNGLHVLDTACGNGALAQELVNQEAIVVALEAEPTLVYRADENSLRAGNRKRPRFLVGGPHDLPRNEKDFHMILCLNNAVSVLDNAAKLAAFLDQTVAMLLPRGRLVMQLYNYDRILDFHDYHLEDIHHPEWGLSIYRSLAPDGKEGLILTNKIDICRSDAMERSVRRSYLWPVRRLQLANMCREAGYTTIQVFADLNGSAWQADSYSTILIAIRDEAGGSMT